MKIAFVGQKGIPCTQGGIERYAEELSTRLVARDLEVTVYTRPYYTPKSLTQYQGVRLVSLPTIKSKHLDAITHSVLSTLHAVFVLRADVIHYMNVGPALVCFLPRLLKPRTRVVGTFQCRDWTHEKWGGFAQLSLKTGAWMMNKFSHQVFAVSSEIQEFVERHFNKKLPLITNGVSLGESLNNAERDSQLQKFGLLPQSYIFSASRLIRHKGIHYLIDAFKQAKEQTGDSELKLVIAGDGFHTDTYVHELKKHAADRADIIFVGSQTGDAFKALFQGARMFVLPSEAEGFSLVLLESLGLGIPTICSDIAPNMDAVTDDSGEAVALVFKNTQVADLTQKLIYGLTHDLSDMTRKAILHVRKTFDWETITDQISVLYATEEPVTSEYEIINSPMLSDAHSSAVLKQVIDK